MFTVHNQSHTNGQAPGGDTGQQKRALRRLLRDFVIVTGAAIGDLDAAPRKAPQRNRSRLLYRSTANLPDSDVDRLVCEIGAARLWAALERATSPQRPLVAAE